MDISQIIDVRENLRPAMEKACKAAAETLTAQTHAHIVEQVQGRLRSTREKYLDHLGFHQVSENVWVVDLMPGAMFIEEGLPANFDMIDSLLDDKPKPGSKPGADRGVAKGKTKTAKDGSRYRVIPFEHQTAKTRQTPAQTNLTDTIKAELKRQKLPGIGKIELGADGKPRQGLIRSLDIMTKPVKTGEGPGQGKGPTGAVKQGPTGIPLLQGIRIYQRQVKDKQGKEHTKKFVMTFRVVSSKHKGQGRWVHPGLEPRRFMDEAFEWSLREWKEKIGPDIVAKLVSEI